MSRASIASIVLALLLSAGASGAADGVVEINQVRALAGSVTPGDAAGFPVQLGQRGSYRLTGDLTVPADVGGIELAADDISLDLNGFAVRGPTPCAPSGSCAGTSAGIYAAQAFGGNGAMLVGGEVSNFPGACVSLRDAAHVEGLAVAGCGGVGIETGGGGLVLENHVEDTVGPGLRLGGSAFRGNTLRADPGYFFENGRPIGGNVCKSSPGLPGLYDGACTSDGRRRFYLTKFYYRGDQVFTACAPGFHFASVWEILAPSDHAYDPLLGASSSDAILTGPPSGLAGWAGNGLQPDGAPSGRNCAGWTSSVPGTNGNAFGLEHNVQTGMRFIAVSTPCSTPIHVWCVED